MVWDRWGGGCGAWGLGSNVQAERIFAKAMAQGPGVLAQPGHWFQVWAEAQKSRGKFKIPGVMAPRSFL